MLFIIDTIDRFIDHFLRPRKWDTFKFNELDNTKTIKIKVGSVRKFDEYFHKNFSQETVSNIRNGIEIADPDAVNRIVITIKQSSPGWYVPWAGVPIESLAITFYREDERCISNFGLDNTFMTTYRGGVWFKQILEDEKNNILVALESAGLARNNEH